MNEEIKIEEKKDMILANGNVVLPQKEIDKKVKKISKLYQQMFDILGYDLTDPQIKDSPTRIAKMWVNELLIGNFTEAPKLTVFPNDNKNDDMVVVGPIDFFSNCSHHFQTFFGQVWIGYIPNEKIAGISKFARITDWFARRPQIQEQLTHQIAEYLENELNPLGLAVYIEATHMCMSARGAKKPISCKTKTSKMIGTFLDDQYSCKKEFFDMVKMSK